MAEEVSEEMKMFIKGFIEGFRELGRELGKELGDKLGQGTVGQLYLDCYTHYKGNINYDKDVGRKCRILVKKAMESYEDLVKSGKVIEWTEEDMIKNEIKSLPTQSKNVLSSILLNVDAGKTVMGIRDVYGTYRKLCQEKGISAENALSLRGVTNILWKLDLLGIVDMRRKKVSRAEGCIRVEIRLARPSDEIKRLLLE